MGVFQIFLQVEEQTEMKGYMKHIKNYFNRSRIGILLAYALLHMIIHAHNTSILTNGRRITRSIEASPVILEKCQKKNASIGIVRKPAVVDPDHWEIDMSQTNIDLEMIVQVYRNAKNKFK